MITSWPKNLPALGTSPEYFAEIVETMSNGRMKVRVYGANELVGGLEVFDAVSQGVAEIGHSGAYYWQGKIHGAPLFSSIPGHNYSSSFHEFGHTSGQLSPSFPTFLPMQLSGPVHPLLSTIPGHK